MKKVFVFPVFILLLLNGCVSQSTYDLKAKEFQTLTSQNDDLQAQVKALTGEVEALKKDRESLTKEKDAVLKERDELLAKNNELSLKAEKAEQLEKATQTYQDLQKKLEKKISEGQL